MVSSKTLPMLLPHLRTHTHTQSQLVSPYKWFAAIATGLHRDIQTIDDLDLGAAIRQCSCGAGVQLSLNVACSSQVKSE